MEPYYYLIYYRDISEVIKRPDEIVERLRRSIGNPLTLSKTETFADLTGMIIHLIDLAITSCLPRLSKHWLTVFLNQYRKNFMWYFHVSKAFNFIVFDYYPIEIIFRKTSTLLVNESLKFSRRMKARDWLRITLNIETDDLWKSREKRESLF